MKIGELSSFGIGESLVKRLNDLGYDSLTTVQERAVRSGLFDRKNIVVSAPTNTGKTFVGELAAIVASTQREGTHTFYLVPLKALAEEKFHDFSRKYSDWGLRIAISTRDRTEYDEDLLSFQVIIATYEKMNSLLVRNSGLVDQVGVVVVDELQNIADPSRGVTLEILLTSLIASNKRPQIVGLSATVSNAQQVSSWLNAVLVETDKRDVNLREGILYTGAGQVNFNAKTLRKGDFVYRDFNEGNISTENALPYYTTEGLGKVAINEQILVFAQTQKQAERVALRLARELPSVDNITDTMEDLDEATESTPSTRRLKETLQNGVAFHHAGLLPEERIIVEEAFSKGLARVICATTTLGAGVNTPAKTVVFLTHETYDGQNIRTRDYKNMAGRAGRIRDPESYGRSVLFAESEREMQMLWTQYVQAKAEPLESQIGKSERLSLSILGLVSSGVCSETDILLNFMKSTFFGQIYRQQTAEELRKAFDDSILLRVRTLEADGFLTVMNGQIKVTELGKRCSEELLSPSTAKLFYDTLRKFESRLQGEKDYKKLIEPLIHLACSSSDAISNGALMYWPKYEPEQKELADYWNFNKNSFLYELSNNVLLIRALRTTRMIIRWIEGVPYGDLTSYADHGIIKRDAETVSWIVRGLSRIAERPLFNFNFDFVRFLRGLSERIFHGVPDSSLQIMRMKLPQVNRHRAMALAQVGFDSVDRIIEATPEELMKARGIQENIALEIKRSVEQHITDKDVAAYHRQRRLAQALGRNVVIIERLYKEKGNNFARTINDILRNYIGLNAAFVGDASGHEADVIIEDDGGKIVIECKRYDNRNVSAKEAEEVLGEGARHNPIAHVTIGYPDFADDAKLNCTTARVTLLPASVLGEILIGFWQKKISREDVLKTLKSARYVEDPFQESTELTLLASQ